MAEDRNIYKIHDNGSLGEVQIADEVVAIIAGLAATEVEGVGSMAGNITNELVGKLGMKNLSKEMCIRDSHLLCLHKHSRLLLRWKLNCVRYHKHHKGFPPFWEIHSTLHIDADF